MGWWLLPILALAVLRPTYAQETTCDGVCGRRPLARNRNLRVLGGTDVLPGTWPWMVSFEWLTKWGYASFCGGTLISPRWVVSAAHCFQKPKEIPQMSMSIGANRIRFPGDYSRRRSIKRLVNHEYFYQFWNGTYHVMRNDIAVVEMNEPVNCSDYIQPACLPDSSVELSLLRNCYVSGFGIMNEKSEICRETGPQKERPGHVPKVNLQITPSPLISFTKET